MTCDFETRALFFVLVKSSADSLRVSHIASSWNQALLGGPLDGFRNRLKKTYFDKVPLINESTG